MTQDQQETLNEMFLGKEDPDMAFKIKKTRFGRKKEPEAKSSLSPERKRELNYILKSHACTQVAYDEASLRDYPKMFNALLEFIEKEKTL